MTAEDDSTHFAAFDILKSPMPVCRVNNGIPVRSFYLQIRAAKRPCCWGTAGWLPTMDHGLANCCQRSRLLESFIRMNTMQTPPRDSSWSPGSVWAIPEHDGPQQTREARDMLIAPETPGPALMASMTRTASSPWQKCHGRRLFPVKLR